MPGINEIILEPSTSFAVVGASNNPEKYGNKIYRNLKKKGFKVFPVNPNRDAVEGDQAWANLSELPEPPTVAVLVVPPSVGVGVVADAAEAGISNVWVQPGAFSEEVAAALEAGDFDWIAEACVMTETRGVSISGT